jgi:hypothetical protein
MRRFVDEAIWLLRQSVMFKARKSRLEMPMLCIVLTIGAPALAFAYSSAAAAGGRGGDDADAGGERDV